MSFTKYHLAYAALMHDIGKFVQRTGAADLEQSIFTSKCQLDDTKKYLTYKHVMWTTEFLYRYSLPIEDWDSICEVAGCHHNPYVFNQDNYKVYLDYLREADHCSSSWDREQAEDYYGKYRANKVPLYSVFSRISLDQKKATRDERAPAYRLAPLSPENAVPTHDFPADLKQDYQKLWQEFEREFAAMHQRFLSICEKDPVAFVESHFQQYINCAQALLEKYTWCIPSNTVEKAPTNSLYHHSKNTALIASTLYAAAGDGAQKVKVTSLKKPFMLISCDLNGIQHYLYDLNPENSRKAAKLLRARSTQVKVIMDLLAAMVIDELDLCWQNIMLNVSGKWFILAPATEENVHKLERIRVEIENDIYSRFLGTLSVNLDWSTLISIADLGKHHFLDTLTDSILSLEQLKLGKFKACLSHDGKWQSDAFVISDQKLYASNICQYCHRRPISSPSKEACPQCEKEIELGRMLADSESEVFKVFTHPKANALVRLGEYCLALASKDELADPFPKTDYFYIQSNNNHKNPLPIRPYAASVPRHHNGDPMDFGEITKQTTRGLQALSIIKGDVDDLSLIFQEGLKHLDQSGKEVCSITDYTTFSSMVDYFFSHIVPHEIGKTYPNTVYTVYSGGDDFCLVGAWQDIIELGNEMTQRFQKFCAGNPQLHFSAAITMLHPKAPLRFVIDETEALLKRAKEKSEQKNTFYLFETFIPTFLLPEQLENAKELNEKLNDTSDNAKGVTKQLLYRLLGYQQMYENTRQNTLVTRDNLYDALLHYDIRRNIMRCDRNGLVRNEEVVKLFQSYTDISSRANLQYLRIPVCHTLYLNRETKEAPNESTKTR